MPGVYEKTIPLKQREIIHKTFETQAADHKFTSALQKGFKPGKLEVEYGLQSRKRVGHKGIRDGQDHTSFGKQERVPCKARSMELRDDWQVTQKTEATTQDGIQERSEKAKQKAEALIRLKDQMESRFLSDAPPVMEAGNTDADETAGVFWWLLNATSSYFNLPEAHRVPTGCTYTGALASFTEKSFDNMVEEAYEARNGGDLNLDGFVGSKLKRRFTDFSTADTDNSGTNNLRTYNFDGTSKKLVRCINVLEMDNSMVRLHPTTYLLRDRETGESHADARRSGVFLEMDRWYLDMIEALKHNPLENKGGGPRGFWSVNLLLRPESILGSLAIRCAS